jgi:hypothetical protein
MNRSAGGTFEHVFAIRKNVVFQHYRAASVHDRALIEHALVKFLIVQPYRGVAVHVIAIDNAHATKRPKTGAGTSTRPPLAENVVIQGPSACWNQVVPRPLRRSERAELSVPANP